jgi:hypothetical protein
VLAGWIALEWATGSVALRPNGGGWRSPNKMAMLENDRS